MAAQLMLLYFILCLTVQVNPQECHQTDNLNGLPSFGDYHKEGMILGREHQAIIPSYTPSRFCNSHTCGNITRWGIDVHRGGKKHQNVYTLDLQVWRPSPTVNNSTGSGCYSLVGNNTFTKISLLLPNQVAMVTPSPQDYIQFRPGDMLGFYVSSAPGASTNDGVVALTSGFSSELLWYASIAPSLATSRCGNCPYSVGRNGVLDMTVRGAPVISVCVETYSCPLLKATIVPSTSIPLSTSTVNVTPSPHPTPLASSSFTASPSPTTKLNKSKGTPSLSPLNSFPVSKIVRLREPSPSSNTGHPHGPKTFPATIAYILAIGGTLMVLIITVTVAIVVILAVYLKLQCRKASGESTKEGIAIGTIDGHGDHVHAEQNTSRGNYSAEDLEKTVEVTPNEAYVCTTCVITQTSEAHQPASGSVEDSYEDYGY